MGMSSVNCEIMESIEESDFQLRMGEQAGKDVLIEPEHQYSIEDDINRLFETIDVKRSARGLGLSQQAGRDALWKKAMKRTMRASSSPSSGIGITEPVSLKQALRGLCISQASEMAALKRLSKPKPAAISGALEAGSIKRLYRAVVTEAGESGIPINEGIEHFMEISLVPENNTSFYAGRAPDSLQFPRTRVLDPSASSSNSAEKTTHKPKLTHNNIVPLHSEFGSEKSTLEVGHWREIRIANSSCTLHTGDMVSKLHETSPTPLDISKETTLQDNEHKGKLHSASSPSSSSAGNKLSKISSNSSRFIKPVFRNKNYVKKKVQQVLISASKNSDLCNGKVGIDNDAGQSPSNMVCQPHQYSLKNVRKGDRKSSDVADSGLMYCSRSKIVTFETDAKSESREKGEFSQSSKSSIGDCSSSTCTSEVSSLSRSSRSGNRPHMSKDLRWEAIHCVQEQQGNLSLRNFKLLRKLGCGDIGSVYLAELSGTSCQFALKVMDNEFLLSKKKMLRAQTEREIMQMLDHPFLPTLYAHFTSDKLSCLVMEYCPGGDLHVLRQRQLSRSFSEQAARFYVAEVLLALEYLHMLGVVYRDLKPENILVREDGHIMLSDFDLSLRCAVRPTLLKSASVVAGSAKKISNPCTESSCINPFCLHPSWQVPCFTLGFVSAAEKTRKLKSEATQVTPWPQLVVEPTSARSNSFVGTHEYLAPEIIKGEGHGSAVDWWMFGIFLYELLYGKTPFKGSENEDTLSNVVSQGLKFPETSIVSFQARDLIRRLLIKEPENRLGSIKGAAEIKQHSFFEGLNWALIRCAIPPEMPRPCDVGSGTQSLPAKKKDGSKCTEQLRNIDADFDLF